MTFRQKLFGALPVVVWLICPGMVRASSIPSGPTPDPSRVAANAINSLGIDLLHKTGRIEANALLSPYSIETALAMAFAGGDGATRTEMAEVLRLPEDQGKVDQAFLSLRGQLETLVQKSKEDSTWRKQRYGDNNDSITLDIANRLFGQQGFAFRPAFLDSLKTNYGAPLDQLDFVKDSAGGTGTINDWVAAQTHQRIRDLIPAGNLDASTRMVLVNALYFRAPWATPFSVSDTRPSPFYPADGASVEVPTMTVKAWLGYLKTNGFTVLTIPYGGNDIHLLVILPENHDGLKKTEAALSTDLLSRWANLPFRQVKLYLPKFRIAPPTLPLAEALQLLGMTTAFDNPRGSANFDRMAPRHSPSDYLCISRVFHRTFLELDEKGSEAAAATATLMLAVGTGSNLLEPIEVKVDHPFIFAIQHRASGACFFIGHLVNPRMTNL